MSAERLLDTRAEASALLSGAARVPGWRSAVAGLVIALAVFAWHEFTGAFDCFSNMGDEGMEVNKAVLVAAGHRLYTEVWNDQPPVYTHVLSGLCRGEDFTMARLRRVSFAFVALLFLAFAGAGASVGLSLAELLCAGGFLAASPTFLLCSASTTLELPALAVGLLGGCVLLAAFARDSVVLGAVGGAVLGLGVMVKLTALTVLPLVVAVFCVELASALKRRLLVAGSACMALLLTAATVWWACAGEASWHHLLRTHFGDYPALDAETGEALRFFWSWLSLQPWFVGAALVGVAVLVRGGRKIAAMVLASWALTELAVFSTHFPWWACYSVHLSAPLALLAGAGLWGAVRWVLKGPSGSAFLLGGNVLAAMAAAACLWEWGEAFSSERNRVRGDEHWTSHPVVQCPRENRQPRAARARCSRWFTVLSRSTVGCGRCRGMR